MERKNKIAISVSAFRRQDGDSFDSSSETESEARDNQEQEEIVLPLFVGLKRLTKLLNGDELVEE